MSDVLSQAEIESLLQDMNSPKSGADPTDADALESGDLIESGASGANLVFIPHRKVVLPLSRRRVAALTPRTGSLSYELYDFRRSDRFAKEQLRSLQVIHENFARLFTSSLSAYLRATIQFDLVSIDQLPYQEYIRSVASSLINILNIAPLNGQGILDLNLRFLFAMIDRLLGGTGQAHIKPGKDLTDVEKVLARNIVRKALSDLESAWHDILPLEFAVASVETSSQFIQIIPDNDTVILLLFDLRLGDEHGTMTLAIPYVLLKPMASRLSAQRWFQSAKRTSGQYAPQMAQRLRTLTQVPCIARLGTSQVTVSALAGLEVGQILPLDIAPGNNSDDGAGRGSLACVDLLVGDKPKFRGHIGLSGGKRLAVQIDDVITPPPGLLVHKDPAA